MPARAASALMLAIVAATATIATDSAGAARPSADEWVEVPTPHVFPTEETTGVPDGVTLVPWDGHIRTSEATSHLELSEGEVCKIIERVNYDFGTSSDFLYVDDPCVIFRQVRFTTQGMISNTSAMIQQGPMNHRIVVEQSEFDGGPNHQRGIQADYGGITVTGSSFTRFGNAAVEMNDREGLGSYTVEGNYLYQPRGWAYEDHVDGLQVGGGGAVTIRNNTILIEPFGDDTQNLDYVSNSAIGLWAEIGDVTGPVVVEGNLLAGGGRVIYIEEKDSFRFDGPVSVTGNVFDRRYVPSGGIWGALADVGLPAQLTWHDNTWEDGTTVVGLHAAMFPPAVDSGPTTSGSRSSEG